MFVYCKFLIPLLIKGNTNNHQNSGAGQLEMRESLLSQALESSHNSISSNNHHVCLLKYLKKD